MFGRRWNGYCYLLFRPRSTDLLNWKSLIWIKLILIDQNSFFTNQRYPWGSSPYFDINNHIISSLERSILSAPFITAPLIQWWIWEDNKWNWIPVQRWCIILSTRATSQQHFYVPFFIQTDNCFCCYKLWSQSTFIKSNLRSEWQVQMYLHLLDVMLVLTASLGGTVKPSTVFDPYFSPIQSQVVNALKSKKQMSVNIP